MKLRSILSALVLTAGVAAAPTAKSAIIVSVQEAGTDVLATASGSADTTGFSTPTLGTLASGGIWPRFPLITFNPGPTQFFDGLSGPSSFGGGGLAVPTSVSGLSLGMSGPRLLLPADYLSGSPLSASMTFSSATLAGLGLTNGTYTWTWGSGDHADSLTLYIGVPVPSAVPVPASLLLLATGVAAATTLRRRKTT